jgi:hypothetical protein
MGVQAGLIVRTDGHAEGTTSGGRGCGEVPIQEANVSERGAHVIARRGTP